MEVYKREPLRHASNRKYISEQFARYLLQRNVGKWKESHADWS